MQRVRPPSIMLFLPGRRGLRDRPRYAHARAHPHTDFRHGLSMMWGIRVPAGAPARQVRSASLRTKLRLLYAGQGNFGALLQTMAARMCIFALNVGSGVVTARGMGAEGRGMLTALITWPQFIAYLMTFGMVNAMMYRVKSEPAERGRFFGAALCLTAVAGLLATATGVILIPLLLRGYPQTDVWHAQALMMVAPAVLLALIIQTAAEAAADFAGANALRCFSVAGTFAGTVFLYVSSSLAPASAAFCYLLPQVPLTVWLLMRLWPHYRPNLRRFANTTSRLIRYGIRCYPVEFINAASTYIGQSIVVALVAPVGVGWFTVSLSIARLLEIFYATVSTVLLPATAARPKSEVLEKTARAARLTALLMAIFMAPLYVLLPWLLPLVYGSSFADAVPIARMLLLEALLSGTVWVLLQGFLALERPGLATILQVTGICASVTFLALIVPHGGARDAAKVLLGIGGLKLTLTIALYRLALGMPLRIFAFGKADLAYARDLMRSEVR